MTSITFPKGKISRIQKAYKHDWQVISLNDGFFGRNLNMHSVKYKSAFNNSARLKRYYI